MTKLVPSIDEMLLIGHGCGLTTLDEAYSNYMNHYDMFFLVDEYATQYNVFLRDLAIRGYLEEVEVEGISRAQLIEANIEDLIDVTRTI